MRTSSRLARMMAGRVLPTKFAVVFAPVLVVVPVLGLAGEVVVSTTTKAPAPEPPLMSASFEETAPKVLPMAVRPRKLSGSEAGESPESRLARSNQTGSAVVQCVYSTGQNGSRLKWRTVRRLEVRDTSQSQPDASQPLVKLATLNAPVVGSAPNELDPFDDPFGDAQQQATEGTDVELPVLAVPPTPTNDVSGADEVGQSRAVVENNAQLGAIGQSVDSQDVSDSVPATAEDQPLGELEQALAAGPQIGPEKCPELGKELNALPEGITPISKLTHEIKVGPGRLPTDCPVSQVTVAASVTRGWEPITFTWKASGLCHRPAYFEQTQVERYGHSLGPIVQPIVSGAHFFATVPLLPYKMGLYPPNECVYTLGYYRPGSCAPFMLDPLPFSLRAAMYEAAAVTGLVFILP